eukprot:SAG22_NODE_217_length_14910_cov_65.532978_1_plen_175_part_00
MEINGVHCASCLDGKKPRQVILDFARLQTAGPSVTVHISFGVGAGGAGTAAEQQETQDTGVAAQQRWDQAQAERSTVSPAAAAAAAPGCALSPTAAAALNNVTAFSTAMTHAGLAGRFENLQAAAVREALNVSVTRCSRRASGAIGPIAGEPASWKKYKMGYNQSLVEAYFTDQ